MDSSDENSDNEFFLPTGGGQGDIHDFPVPEICQLKPKLDSIFSEVEKNLPSIDFDLSDVSSDNDDQEIFHRSVFKTSLFDDDKDLDTSMCDESLSELLQPDVDTLSLTNISLDIDKCPSSSQSYDNDVASGRKPAKNVVSKGTTSWTNVVIEAHEDRDKFVERQAPAVVGRSHCECQTENELDNISGALNLMETELEREDSFSLLEKSEDVEKHEKESTSESKHKEKRGLKSGVGAFNTGDKRMNRMMRAEEMRRNEHELVSNIVPTSPIRLLTNSQNLNIDLILNTLEESHSSSVPPIVREAWARQQRIQSLIGAGEGSNRFLEEHTEEPNEAQTLIQKLAQFSMEQSGEDLTDIDPTTGAKRVIDEDADINVRENQSHRLMYNRIKFPPSDKEEKTKSSSCGTNTSNDSQPLRIITPTPRSKIDAEKTPESRLERDTVFLDLRNFDQKCKEQQQSIERVQRVLQIGQDSGSSDSDSEDDMQSWFDQRRKMKESISRGVCAEILPSKPKPYRSEPFKRPNRVLDLSKLDNRLQPQSAENQEEELTEEQVAEMEKQRKAQEEEKERQRKIEEARKQREEREAERQSRLRLSKRLEALRPTASISGKQDCAEATSVIYDMEASYEPSPSTLPPFLPSDKEVLLLTIHLSSNGEIILHRGKTNKSVDTGVGLSASYTALLTWLLSLVPENYDFLLQKSHDGVDVAYFTPFIVLGMQQLWIDENLCLVVAVTPHELFSAKHVPSKPKKSKLKDEVKHSSPFQQMMTKFLSTNTLHSVCLWLQDMVSVEVPCQSSSHDGSPTYIYKPPLPNITTKPLSTFIQINHDPQAAQKVFNTSVGFFWQTVDSEESSYEHGVNDTGVQYDTQITMSLIYKKIFQDPRSMMGIFNKILQEGLDLAGVRLLYPIQELLHKPHVPNEQNRAQSNIEFLNKVGPVLAVGLRGTFARSIWLDAVGPTDPALARRTDPNSLCALYGGNSRDECLLFCPRNPARVHTEITRWFGGRVPPGGVIDVGTPYTRKDHLRSGSPKGHRSKKGSTSDAKEEKSEVVQRRPPACLTATTKSEIIVVLSPVIQPNCTGVIMATCQRRGYQIRGIRRSRLTSKKAGCLGIDSSLLSTFCPGLSEMGVPTERNIEASSPCCLLLLEKENAAHSAASLIEACMMQLTLQGIMGNLQASVDYDLQSRHLFYAARYSESLLMNLGGDFSKCIDHEIQVNPSFVIPKLYTNPEVEQITILLLLGHEIQKSSGLFVGKLLNLVPYSKTPTILPLKEGFELLGLKWIPNLTTSQAKEVTPFEVGDRMWKENIHVLMSEPALVLALRSVDAFHRLESVIPQVQIGKGGKVGHIDYLMSRNAEEAYGFARAFFTDKEIFSDPSARPLLPYLPQSRHHIQGYGSRSHSFKTDITKESMFDIMLSGPQPITTLLVIKPRAVKKHLPKVFRKITLEGFSVVGLRMAVLSQDECSCLIDEERELDNERIGQHITYLTSGPSIIMALQRENAVKKLLDLLGPCDPMSARRQSQFLWRGTFGVDQVMNGLHASKNYLQAVQEQRLFFKDGLCCKENEDLKDAQIQCPAEDTLMDTSYHDKRFVRITDMPEDAVHSSVEIQLLLQTTCIVLKPPIMKVHDRGHYVYVDIVEELLKQGFELVASRMVWFTQEQAEVFLHVVNAGSYKQVPVMLSGPSLVLALQRDNAVIAFDSIMGSDYGSESLIGKYGGGIFRPKDTQQAHRMIEFFFDHLMPGSQVEIIPK